MADLRALIEKNLSFTLEGDFGMRVNLIAPDGIKDTTTVDGRPLKGQVLHSITRDGEQMNGLIGRVTVDVPVVTLRRSSLRRVPFPGENWIVEIPDSPRPGAPMIQYALSSTRTPEGGKSIGTIRLYLQYIEQVLAVYADDLTSDSTVCEADFITPVFADDLAGTPGDLDAATLQGPPPTDLPDYSIASDSTLGAAEATGIIPADDLTGASTLSSGNGATALPADDLAGSGTVSAGPWAPVSTITFIVAGDLAANDLSGSGTIASGAWTPTASIAFTNFTESVPASTIEFTNFGE